jgi:hypothetical protein
MSDPDGFNGFVFIDINGYYYEQWKQMKRIYRYLQGNGKRY